MKLLLEGRRPGSRSVFFVPMFMRGCTFKCSQLCVVESLLDFIDGLGFLLRFELSAYRTDFVLCHFDFFAMKINLFDFLYIKGKSTLYLLIFES
jgi:hypothetical protein